MAKTSKPADTETATPIADVADAPVTPSGNEETAAPADVSVAPSTDTGDPIEPDPADDVVCRVRAPAGPRRRAGLAFDVAARPLTRRDLGGDVEAIAATLKTLMADPRLSVLPPT